MAVLVGELGPRAAVLGRDRVGEQVVAGYRDQLRLVRRRFAVPTVEGTAGLMLAGTSGCRRGKKPPLEPSKNVQVIDGAMNCTYSVFSATNDDFKVLFPRGRDVEFIEDFWQRVGDERGTAITKRLFAVRADKKTIHGIHGTLFYQLPFKKQFYPTKKESEMSIGD